MDNPFLIIDARLENIEKCLAKIMSVIEGPVTNTQLQDKVEISLSIAQLAEYLGVTKATVFKYKREAVFPFYQAGRTVYFKKHEVDQALSFGKKRKAKCF